MRADIGRMPRQRGFNLMELMVTIAILGIISAVAYPSYTAYIRRANRTDATSGLIQAAQGLQRCYSQSSIFSYQSCAIPASSPNGYYTIAATTLTGPSSTALSTFVLTATPATRSPQTRDTQCTSFTIDSVGRQAAYSGSTVNTTVCWPGN